ncbi:MAG: hypothetical protein K2H61_00950 [Muribaculaceae bacterium]|nr:hypothetical protein [Muribaculaceae bacterium]
MSFSARKACLTAKSIGLWLLKSHRCRLPKVRPGSEIYILGNGPSLASALADHAPDLAAKTTMAVNFFANTEAFRVIKPDYYILADPHFFRSGREEPNVAALFEALGRVDWPMTLLVPFAAGRNLPVGQSDNLKIVRYNALRGEGFRWLTHPLFRANRAMPRPRNVMIPAIMTAIGMGFERIKLLGADHSWTATLSVNDRNEVVSVQPHFYKDSDRELSRQRTEQMHRPLHQLLESFAISFRAYHEIADYATSRGITIVNLTPGSFIDAFPRATL